MVSSFIQLGGHHIDPSLRQHGQVVFAATTASERCGKECDLISDGSVSLRCPHAQNTYAANAPRADETDWDQIAALYELLLGLTPTPVVELNRAVAIAMARGPEDGLALVDQLGPSDLLQGYYLLHATRADLLRRLERPAEAAAAYRQALALVGSDAERRFLTRRLAEVSGR